MQTVLLLIAICNSPQVFSLTEHVSKFFQLSHTIATVTMQSETHTIHVFHWPGIGRRSQITLAPNSTAIKNNIIVPNLHQFY